MHILAADDDHAFRRFLKATIGDRTAHVLELVPDGKQALVRALSEPRPDVVMLDWMMPQLDGTQVCRLLRARADPPYLMVVTSRGRREEVLSCLHAGADDVLTKPVPPDVLIARVDVAERRRRVDAAHSGHVREAIQHAVAQGDGELVVRSGQVTARVFVHAGAIAWADVSSGCASLLHGLIAEGCLDAEVAREAVEECRRAGVSLVEVMVAWEVFDRGRMRARVAEWLRVTLLHIVALPAARTLFLPQRRRYSGALLYALDELLPASGPELQLGELPCSLPPPDQPSLIPGQAFEHAFASSPEPRPELEVLLDRCMQLDGMLGLTAFGRLSGYCLSRRGVAINPDVAWAQIQTLNNLMRNEPVEDSIVCTGQRYHVVRLVPGTDDVFLYALVDASRVRLAMVRLQLQDALRAAGA